MKWEQRHATTGRTCNSRRKHVGITTSLWFWIRCFSEDTPSDLTYLAILLEIFRFSTQVHVVLTAPNEVMTGETFRSRVPIRLSGLVGGPNVHIHELVRGLANTLRTEYGFVDLPECIGGSWTFYQWRRERWYLESSIEFCRVSRPEYLKHFYQI
jgi:hypothetical protein